MPTGASIVGDDRRCDFDTINDFFDYANENHLNITMEVQNCQNLCLLTYGVGNPDLSGIGMMYAYSIQTSLTILVGPIYRLFYLRLAKTSSFIRDLKAVQTNFFSSNGFFVGSSALATLVHLSQNPPTFEIAEMQAMAFLQVNSILVTFFCLVVAQPMSRWAARVVLYFVVFVLVMVAVGMVVGLTMMWRQRRYLQSLARDQFEDNTWGFGQIAALTIWAPIPVELLYILNDLAQKKSARWNHWNQAISFFFSPKALMQDKTTPNSDSQPQMKDQGGNKTVVEVTGS
jgi:hypothetical protein